MQAAHRAGSWETVASDRLDARWILHLLFVAITVVSGVMALGGLSNVPNPYRQA